MSLRQRRWRIVAFTTTLERHNVSCALKRPTCRKVGCVLTSHGHWLRNEHKYLLTRRKLVVFAGEDVMRFSIWILCRRNVAAPISAGDATGEDDAPTTISASLMRSCAPISPTMNPGTAPAASCGPPHRLRTLLISTPSFRLHVKAMASPTPHGMTARVSAALIRTCHASWRLLSA